MFDQLLCSVNQSVRRNSETASRLSEAVLSFECGAEKRGLTLGICESEVRDPGRETGASVRVPRIQKM